MERVLDKKSIKNDNLLDRQTDRQSNIELLRILATIGIVFSHATQYMAGGHWWEAFNNPLSLNVILGILFGIWGQVSVAVFISISAYFLCDSNKINYKSLIKLIVQVIVINLLVRIFGLLKSDQINFIAVLKCLKNAILSPISGEYWFITGYICLYLLVPIIQTYLANVSKRDLKILCIILTIVVTCCDFFYIRFAGSIFDFIYCFLLTSYIKKYHNNEFREKSKNTFTISGLLLLIIVILIYIIANITGANSLYYYASHVFVNWNCLIVLNAISLLWIFKCMNVNKNKIINWLAKCSLGVYLLSENSVTTYSGNQAWLWCDIFKLNQYLNSQFFTLKLIGAVALTYIICIILESLRIILFDYGIYKLQRQRCPKN